MGTDEEDRRPDNSGLRSSTEAAETKLSNLRFAVNKSIRYHSKRQRFFESCHYVTTALSAVLGASSFCLLYAESVTAAQFTTAIVGAVTTLDLVFGYNRKANQYRELKCQFSDLQTAVNDIKINQPDLDEHVRRLGNSRVLIQKHEPTALKGLALICHNEECQATRCDDEMYVIPPHIKLLRHFWSFDGWYPVPIRNSNSENAFQAAEANSVNS